MSNILLMSQQEDKHAHNCMIFWVYI